MNRNKKLFLCVKAILLYINVCYVDVYSEWASAVSLLYPHMSLFCVVISFSNVDIFLFEQVHSSPPPEQMKN